MVESILARSCGGILVIGLLIPEVESFLACCMFVIVLGVANDDPLLTTGMVLTGVGVGLNFVVLFFDAVGFVLPDAIGNFGILIIISY